MGGRGMKIKDFTMVSHMNMATCGLLKHSGTIDDPTNIMHLKTISREVYTPKRKGNWGKGKASFYIEGYEEMFDTFEELQKFYNLTQLENEGADNAGAGKSGDSEPTADQKDGAITPIVETPAKSQGVGDKQGDSGDNGS